MSNRAAEAKNPNPNSKSVVLNPNWAQLQQKLKPRRPRPSTAADSTPSALGKRKGRPGSEAEAPQASVLAPTSDDCGLTEALAMDCEMVGVGSDGSKSALGRVTLVNAWGNVVYDEYVRPVEHVVDFRTKISGIRPRNFRNAKNFWVVHKEVSDIIKGRILIGHALHNDLKVLLLSHPKKDIRDTAEYQPLRREGRKRALKDLAAQILNVSIQQKEHCSIEDARAAMLIYKKFRKEWEKSIKEHLRSKKKLMNKRKKKKATKNDLAVESDSLTATALKRQ